MVGWRFAAQQTRGQWVYLLRGLCVIFATMGFMTAIAPFYGPGTSYPTAAVIGVGGAMLLGGAGAFVMLGKRQG